MVTPFAPAPAAARARIRRALAPRGIGAARAGFIVAILSFAGGCVSATEPVAGEPGEQIDLSVYVGSWSVEPGVQQLVDLAEAGPNTLVGTLRSGGIESEPEINSFTARLTRIDGRLVASIHPDLPARGDEPAGWILCAVELNEDGTWMALRGLDPEVIYEAIESGELDGRPLSEPPDLSQVLIEGDSESVRAYLSGHPAAFEGGQTTELVRGEPDAEGRQRYLPSATHQSGPVEPLQAATAFPYPGGADWLPQEGPSSGPGQEPPGIPTRPLVSGPGDVQDGADAGLPAFLNRLLVALAVVLFVGLAAAFAIDYPRRSRAARPQMPSGYVADVPGTEGRPGAVADLGRLAWPAVLIFAVTIGPILYAAVLLQGLAFPSWALASQAGVQPLLHGFAPYLLVFSFGALIGVAEVATTFPEFSTEALGTRWAGLLVLFNAFGSLIVYSAIMAYASSFDHPLVRAFVIAAGFAVLIRTRLVLARDLRAREDSDGVSLDLGWPYARIQRMCRQRIERDLLRDPRYATARLVARFPDSAALEKVALGAIEMRDPGEAADLRARLDAIRAEDIDPGIVRARIARFVADTGGLENTLFLLEHVTPDG